MEMQRRPTAQPPMPLKRSSACSLRSGTAAQRASGRGRRTTAEAGGASGSRPAASVKGTAAGGEGWAGADAGAELSGVAGQSAPAAGGLRRARLHGGSSSVSGGISATDAGTRTAAPAARAAATASASLRCVASSTLRSSRSRACAMPKSLIKRAPSAVAASALPAACRSARVRGELGRRALRPASSTVTHAVKRRLCSVHVARAWPQAADLRELLPAGLAGRHHSARALAHRAHRTGAHPSACRVTVQPLENTTAARFQKRERRRSASGKPC